MTVVVSLAESASATGFVGVHTLSNQLSSGERVVVSYDGRLAALGDHTDGIAGEHACAESVAMSLAGVTALCRCPSCVVMLPVVTLT
jgi:hypothetical protein